MKRRATPLVVTGLTLLFLLSIPSAPVLADDAPDLSVHKAKVSVKQLAKSSRARDSFSAKGVFAAERLPSSFQFDPAVHTVRLSLGGARIAEFAPGEHSGKWKQKNGFQWSLKTKGAERWKLKLNLASGWFKAKGGRLDLGDLRDQDLAWAPVSIEIDGGSFSASVPFTRRGSRWSYRAPRTSTVKSGGSIPPIDPPPDLPPTDLPPKPDVPKPAPSRVLYEYATTNWGMNIWPWDSVARTPTQYQAAWTALVGKGVPPTVDWSKEMVALNVRRGGKYTQFDVFYLGTGLQINVWAVGTAPLRMEVYRMTAVPKVGGTVTWK